MAQTKLMGPLILIGLGVLFLANNFGFHLPYGYLVRRFWPMVLILIGIVKIGEATAVGTARAPGQLTGGVLMVVIGCLFLLQSFAGISVGRTWPIILIAVGVLGFMRYSAVPAGGRGGWR